MSNEDCKNMIATKKIDGLMLLQEAYGDWVTDIQKHWFESGIEPWVNLCTCIETKVRLI